MKEKQKDDMDKRYKKTLESTFEKVFGEAPFQFNYGVYLTKIDEIHRMLKYLLIHADMVNRCILAMASKSSGALVDEQFKAIENAIKRMPNISDIINWKK